MVTLIITYLYKALCLVPCLPLFYCLSSISVLAWDWLFRWQILHRNTAIVPWFFGEIEDINPVRYNNKCTMFFTSGADLHNRWFLCYFQLVLSVWSVPWAYIMFVFKQITINWTSQLPLILNIVPMAISLKRYQFWYKCKCCKLSCSSLSPTLDELVWYWFGHYMSVWYHI